MKENPNLKAEVIHAKGSGFAKKKKPDLKLQADIDKSFEVSKDLSTEDRDLRQELLNLQNDLDSGAVRPGSASERIIKERIDKLTGEQFPGLVERNEELILEERSRLDDELVETRRKKGGSSKVKNVEQSDGTKESVTESVTKESKSIVDDEKDFENNRRQFRFKSWEDYNADQLRFALDFANTAVRKHRIAEDLGVLGKDIVTEEGKNKFSNQQEALNDILERMEAKLQSLESARKVKGKSQGNGPDNPPGGGPEGGKVADQALAENFAYAEGGPGSPPNNPPEDGPDNAGDVTQASAENFAYAESGPGSPPNNPPEDGPDNDSEASQEQAEESETENEQRQPMEVPGAEPVPELQLLEEQVADPEVLEPAVEQKTTIEAGDAQKIREMYELASRAEEKKPRWGWLKERLKGLASIGIWEVHVAEKYRSGTNKAARGAEEGMRDIRHIAEGAVGKDLIQVKRNVIDELKQKLAYTEIQLQKFKSEAENPATKKFAQHENVIKQLGFEVENIKRDIEKREKELTELEEQRRKENLEIIENLRVQGIEGFEEYAETLANMPEGPTKQRAMDNLKRTLLIIAGVEETLRAELGKRQGGMLKRLFSKDVLGYRGEEVLTNEKLARVKRDIFERCIALQQGQVSKDDESVKKLIRKNLDPEWWKRYVAAGVEVAIWAIVAKFALGKATTDYGPLSIETHPPIPTTGSETIGMHKHVWGTTKKYLIDKCGIPNPTDAQVMNASKVVLKQNGLYEQAWQFVKGAKSSRVLPEGFKLLFKKADILASL